MKILGVDYGRKHIGLAVVDTVVPVPLPLRSIVHENIVISAKAIAAVAAEESIEKIVVGVPHRLSGQGEPGDIERDVAALVAALKTETKAVIDTEDERLTTAMVERQRRDAGLSKKRFDKDAAAAAALLETYLARRSE
jgi:putative transcription antitermination factor YqgF